MEFDCILRTVRVCKQFLVLAVLGGMCHLSSQTRGWTCTPCMEAQSLHHWITREILQRGFFNLFIWLRRVLAAAMRRLLLRSGPFTAAHRLPSCGLSGPEGSGSVTAARGLRSSTAGGILAPQPEIKPKSPVLELRSLFVCLFVWPC